MSPVLPSVRVPARDVQVGDELEFQGRMVAVTNNVRCNNGQRGLVTESKDGGVFVLERDPGEVVEVWR